MADRVTLARALALAMVLAALLNGIGTYLKRTGLLEPDAFSAYWSLHCAGQTDLAGNPPERQCLAYTSAEQRRLQAPPADMATIVASYQYVYAVAPAERVLKLAKDFWWLLVLGFSMALLVGAGANQGLGNSWPALVFSLYCAVAWALTLASGPVVAMIGLRSFTFLALPLLARWLVPHVGLFAGAAGILLALQAAAVPLELVRGIHLFREWSLFSLARRVAGTMVHPNSLGVFAVAALAFYWSFGAQGSRLRWVLAGLSISLVLLSGSGTGMLCVAVFPLLLAAARQNGRRVVTALFGAVLIAGTLLALPTLSGRVDIFDSITSGRWIVLRDAIIQLPAHQLVFGSGIGVHTNLALSLGVEGGQGVSGGNPTDSTLTGLVIQVGLVGTTLFYLLLAWAARRDLSARPFYAVIAICTLTINVTEVFPVNALLGLALTRSIFLSRGEAQFGGANA